MNCNHAPECSSSTAPRPQAEAPGLGGSEARREGQLRIAYVSTYPPRECGIATFCEDLLTATRRCEQAGPPLVVAMANGDGPWRYDWPVGLVVDDQDEQAYQEAARFLNDSSVDIVSLQHEFGIFGGERSRGIYRFLDALAKPLVVTLHTVVPTPSLAQRGMVRALGVAAERVIVMNELATEILAREYGVDRRKVVLIHHGAPPPHPEGREAAKLRLGLAGRKVLSTFGLVSPGKGIECALEALPAIRARHPEVCYVVIGKTHPAVQRRHQEGYREELVRLVDRLGLRDAVRFVNSYQSKEGILRWLAASDVYLTPYHNPHQITSGTLAYALAAGRAIVSTPYLYARFLLADGRGLLVDFRDPEAMAEAVNQVLDSPELQARLEASAAAYGRQLLWPAVARRFVEVCRRVVGRQRELATVDSQREVAWGLAIAGQRRDRDAGRGAETDLPGPSPAAH